LKAWLDWQFGLALVAPLLSISLWVSVNGADAAGELLSQPPRFIKLVFFLPVMEEVIFRGALQPVLLESALGGKRFSGLSVANMATSIIFAVVHLLFHSPLWAALVFLPSLLFGYFRDRHNSLLTPVILHVSYNLGYYCVF